jgi:hypothetical protein
MPVIRDTAPMLYTARFGVGVATREPYPCRAVMATAHLINISPTTLQPSDG